MNWLIFTACLATTLVVADAIRCKEDAVCNKNPKKQMCCMHTDITWRLFQEGMCRPMTKKMARCNSPDLKASNGLYMIACPCAEGMTCKPYRRENNLRCQMDDATTVQPETKPTESDQKTEPTQPEEETEPTQPKEETEPTQPKEEAEPTQPKETDPPETNEDGTGNEETGNNGMENDETNNEIGEGPGGEPPRDDDCLDWEYPC